MFQCLQYFPKDGNITLFSKGYQYWFFNLNIGAPRMIYQYFSNFGITNIPMLVANIPILVFYYSFPMLESISFFQCWTIPKSSLYAPDITQLNFHAGLCHDPH